MRRWFVFFAVVLFGAILAADVPGRAAKLSSDPPSLIVIDDPETLPDTPLSGTLYSGALNSNTRVYVFATLPSPTTPPRPVPVSRHVRLALWNVSTQRVQITAIGEARGPGDPFTVGESLLACFFVDKSRARSGTSSQIILPGGEMKLFDIVLRGFGSTVGAMYDLTGVLPGSVKLVATVRGELDPVPRVAPSPFAEVRPWRSGLFDLSSVPAQPLPVRVMAIPRLGQLPFATLGDDCAPLPRINDGTTRPIARYTGPPYLCNPVVNKDGYFDLHGDYGVTRRYSVHLDNSTSSPVSYTLYVLPRGGEVWGTFLFDDEMWQVASVKTDVKHPPFEESFAIKAISVPAYSSRDMLLTTMGQGEAAYPADMYFVPTVNGLRNARVPGDAKSGPLSSITGCAS